MGSRNLHAELRPLGNSGLMVSPVALGCWPIAGQTTLDTNDADSIATIQACFDLGVNHLDTAHVYGPNGESENLIRQAIEGRRDDVVIATKCGIHYEGGTMVTDGRPERLRLECDESLRRLGTDRVELLYLHSPDENVPLEDSAGALRDLMTAGKTRSIGVSNVKPEQLQAFAAVCPLAAVQMPYNMLQRDIERQTIPWCRKRNMAVMVYWPLMKGLLAGKLKRDHVFTGHDARPTYPMYQGEEWRKNQDFVDALRAAAALPSPLPPAALSPLPPGEVATGTDAQRWSRAGEGLRAHAPVVRGSPDPAPSTHTVAQLVVNWTIHQPGITSALCGAKRPWQIEETAGAMGWRLSAEQLAMIDAALQARGMAAAKRVFE